MNNMISEPEIMSICNKNGFLEIERNTNGILFRKGNSSFVVLFNKQNKDPCNLALDVKYEPYDVQLLGINGVVTNQRGKIKSLKERRRKSDFASSRLGDVGIPYGFESSNALDGFLNNLSEYDSKLTG